MKLKKIENAVIHCKTKEEAEILINELETREISKNGWICLWNCYKESTCYRIVEGIMDCVNYIEYYEKNGYTITEFSDLIEPEEQNPVPTAEEAIEWLCKHYMDGLFVKVFGDDYSMDGLLDHMTPKEAVELIALWKSEHEKPEKKEPEVEWVDMCRIIEVLPDGRKRCVHEEDIKPDPELPYGSEQIAVHEILKQYCMEHDGEFIAVHEKVCRVKKD